MLDGGVFSTKHMLIAKRDIDKTRSQRRRGLLILVHLFEKESENKRWEVIV